jgi:aminopeptidase N
VWKRCIALIVVAGCSSSEQPIAAKPERSPTPVVAQRDPLSEASLDADLSWLVSPLREGRGSRTPHAIATAKWIAAELMAAGYKPIFQPIPDAPGQVNVVGERGPADARALIVMAHYDHLGVVDQRMHPGADDNASGVAVALAVARAVAKTELASRVVFLFTGLEEQGLLGAKAYVAAPTVPLERVRAVYNLDMVGRIFDPGSGKPQLVAVGILDDDDHTERARSSAEAVGLTLLPLRAGLLGMIGQDHRSDDWPFRDRDVPAVHFSTGLGPDYHAPTDTADKVSRAQLVRVAKFLRALVAQ